MKQRESIKILPLELKRIDKKAFLVLVLLLYLLVFQ